ncbi:uncharacterized protein LOC114270060 [Camellia sinensis]|uniref:uncharacterized protein LOC114270060 n=1 Tax=Camellia sinensis TaxID=4442 RepID=UPI0010357BA8|nr:uncharacterized protein LOC114270060 [Camellia sinensis]
MLVASTIRGSNATNHHLSSTNVRGLSLFLSLSLSLLYSNPKPKQLRLSLLSSLLSFCSLSSLLLLHHSLHRLHQTAGALLTAPSSSNHWSYHRWFGLSSPTRKASLSLSLSVCAYVLTLYELPSVTDWALVILPRSRLHEWYCVPPCAFCPRINLGDAIGIYPACLAAHKLMRLQGAWCRTRIPNESVRDMLPPPVPDALIRGTLPCLSPCLSVPLPTGNPPRVDTTPGVDPTMKVLGVCPTFRPHHSAPRLALIPLVTDWALVILPRSRLHECFLSWYQSISTPTSIDPSSSSFLH